MGLASFCLPVGHPRLCPDFRPLFREDDLGVMKMTKGDRQTISLPARRVVMDGGEYAMLGTLTIFDTTALPPTRHVSSPLEMRGLNP